MPKRKAFDDDHIPTNREKVLQPVKGASWCGCDMMYIQDWKKCPICSRRNNRRRMKK